ncbi:MAG: hypothetical protein JXA30_04005 [Deltaproteobacteria bacterium]|nr:hypothetical protein [Deltaproteobacteria bacterium]
MFITTAILSQVECVGQLDMLNNQLCRDAIVKARKRVLERAPPAASRGLNRIPF